jgi:hypothetical protein
LRAMRLGLRTPGSTRNRDDLANIVATLGSTVPPVLVIIDSGPDPLVRERRSGARNDHSSSAAALPP